MKASWKKIHREQKRSGWCGPASVQMALLSGGVKVSQEKLARDLYLPWWGTTQQSMLAYLSRYFAVYGSKDGVTLKKVDNLLKKGYTVITNWLDNIDPGDAEGHYSLILGFKKDMVVLGDPAGGRGVWKMSKADFEKRWFDFLDLAGKVKIKRWVLWIDPKSKRDKVLNG